MSRRGPIDAYLDRQLIEEAGVFNPTAVAGLRLGARLLPAGSRAQGVCEAATVMALSVHALYDLFCRGFRASLDRYRRPGAVDARGGGIVCAASP